MRQILYAVAAVLLIAANFAMWLSGIAIPVMLVLWLVGLVAFSKVLFAAAAWALALVVAFVVSIVIACSESNN